MLPSLHATLARLEQEDLAVPGRGDRPRSTGCTGPGRSWWPRSASGVDPDGLLRHPRYLGLRDDKDPARWSARCRKWLAPRPASSSRSGGSTVALSNTGKVLFPDDGITKGELIGYYQATAERDAALPAGPAAGHGPLPGRDHRRAHLPEERGRHFPDWIPRVEVGKQGGKLSQVVCAKGRRPGLPGQSGLHRAAPVPEPGRRQDAPDQLHRPDMLIFDLDPPDGAHFEAVRTAALRLREILEDLGLAAFVKTTGSKGLHVQVPLNGREEFDPVREFARQVAEVLAAAEPDLVTVEQRKDARHAACTRTSCATPTPRPRWRRTRSGPARTPRSRPR